jgi:iron complex transport system ATP-binding protein
VLEAYGVGYLTGGRWIIRGVDLALREGEFLAVLGPNGSGKTTLLRILAGELSPSEGEVRLWGKPLTAYSPKALARRRAVLSQNRQIAFPLTAYEVAFLGRLPHTRGREAPEDHRKTLEALAQTRALPFSDRLQPSLSGGRP